MFRFELGASVGRMCRTAILATCAAGMFAAPAFAEWHGYYRGRPWHHHWHGYAGGYYPPPVVVAPPPVRYYAPPPVVYSPGVYVHIR